ncbi:MAG: hypothetical protein KDA58_08380 [Planctomycetaceae bacterium]|nr:hypothetical protein [Planctomycetaceae bacterium]
MSVTFAQEATIPRVANNAGAPIPSRTGGAATPVQSQLPPGMAALLQTWEQHSASVNRLEGSFERYDYDSVFRVEKRAIGNYYFEAPDKGRMDFLKPKEIPQEPHQVGDIKYQVQADYNQSWICTGDLILDINHDEKTYNRVQIPPEFRGENIVNSPLPFLFGMKAKVIQERYLLAFGSMHDPANGRVHIVAAPLMEAQRREYRRAEVLLDAKTYLPTAVKLFGTSGSKETVYVFTKHDPRRLPWVPTSPFRGSMPNSYKLLDDIAAPQQQGAMIPNGQLPRVAEGDVPPGRTQIR